MKIIPCVSDMRYHLVFSLGDRIFNWSLRKVIWDAEMQSLSATPIFFGSKIRIEYVYLNNFRIKSFFLTAKLAELRDVEL